MKHRNYTLLGTTQSLWPETLELVPAKIIERRGRVYFRKRHPHGAERTDFVCSDVSHYDQMQYSVPAKIPAQFGLEPNKGCPFDCGLCTEHEQHTCVGLVEITSSCNLACPMCYAGSGPGGKHLSLAECRAAIDRLKPAVVMLAGCRLLSRQTLAALPCPVLNYHAGITPKYRGMNGGYWALATGDAGNFGATVHLVDAGVDTGDVLHQVRGKPGHGDNIALYALRLAAMSRETCAKSVEDVLGGRLAPVAPDLPSRQWYHPTIWFYLWTGLTRGVW